MVAELIEREERPGIRIDGLPIADLDFKAMGLRLAYLRAGLAPPPARRSLRRHPPR